MTECEDLSCSNDPDETDETGSDAWCAHGIGKVVDCRCGRLVSLLYIKAKKTRQIAPTSPRLSVIKLQSDRNWRERKPFYSFRVP
jgi:hypothetical protein